MAKDISPASALAASRIAMVGIVAALVLTIAGMVLRSPLLGAAALLIVMIAVIFQHPLARLIVRR